MMKKAVLAGGLIVSPAKEVLLVFTPETNAWSFPKGHVETGESIFETALREISEETSLGVPDDLVFVKELPVYERKTRQVPGKKKEMHLFLFQLVSEPEKARARYRDVLLVKWVPFDKAAFQMTYKEDIDFFTGLKKTL